ncbi:MAG: metallophosphoesterase [Pirellulales bacterium]|nr:metallophosphoesterase [Pirellulales bacterium]
MNRRRFLGYAATAPLAAPLVGGICRGESDAAARGETVELTHPDSFMLAVLPDTQIYTTRPEWHRHFFNQTRWIAENAERLNIKYVIHEGDIVNDNLHEQWKVAQAAMQLLDGVVPYSLSPGNHDYGQGGSANDRTTLLNDYFAAEACARWPTFGGVMEPGRLENSYHVFEAGGRRHLVLALEWGPREATVAWANDVADKHGDCRLILATHAYLYYDDTRYDWQAKGTAQHWNPHVYGNCKSGGCHDGEQLWQRLVRRRANFLLTLNGHVLEDGAGRLASRGDGGNLVHQLLANYQNRADGGEGYLRLLEFPPDDKSILVRTYSPSTRAFKTDDQQQFTLPLDGVKA